MLTGEVKQRLIQVLTELVERHRKARAAVTDEVHASGTPGISLILCLGTTELILIDTHLVTSNVLLSRFFLIAFMSGWFLYISFFYSGFLECFIALLLSSFFRWWMRLWQSDPFPTCSTEVSDREFSYKSP